MRCSASGLSIELRLDGKAGNRCMNYFIFGRLVGWTFRRTLLATSTLLYRCTLQLLLVLFSGISGQTLAQDFTPEPAVLEISTVSQSSTSHSGVPTRAIDGNTSGVWGQGSVTHTRTEDQPWWSADLGVVADIHEIEIWNRTNCCTFRLSDFYVLVSESPFLTGDLNTNLNDSSIWSYFHAGELDGAMVTVPADVRGRYVRVQLQGRNPLSLAEVIVSGSIASNPPIGEELKPVSVSQSSTSHSGIPTRAIDGNTSGVWGQGSVTHTRTEDQPWWSADLGVTADIREIEVWNRTNCCTFRLSDFYVLVSESPFSTGDLNTNVNDSSIWSYFHDGELDDVMVTVPVDARGRYVRVQLQGRNPLSLAEVIFSGSLVSEVANVAPIADAGGDIAVQEGVAITLNGAASRDTDGTIQSYLWTLNGVEVGTGITPVLNGLAAGVYVVDLAVTDNDGAIGTDSVGVTVNAVDTGELIANNDFGGVSVPISVFANDIGVTANAEIETNVSLQAQRGFLIVDQGAHTITYIPYGGDPGGGTDSFGYRFRAGPDLSNVATVTINFSSAGNTLAANDDAVSVSNGIAVIDVLANDSGEVDPSTVAVPSSRRPQNGLLQINGQTGVITYTADNGATGTDSFGYTVEDNNGSVSNIATVTVTIGQVSDENIVASNDSASVANAGTVTVDLLANDTGAGSGASVAIVAQPENGSVTLTADGSAIYQHDGATTTTDSFSYRVTAPSGVVSNVAFVELSIGAAPPVFTAGVVEASHRNGQTFLIWNESAAADEYHVYRHSVPIDAANLNSAQKITQRWGALDSNTSVNTYRGYGSSENFPENFVINDLGPALSDDQGLFVYTTQQDDSATAYYAVTSVRNGVEDPSTLQLADPVTESVAEPTDVLTVSVNGGSGRIYTQFMDYSNWNPTLNGYIYHYAVALPAGHDASQSYPLMIEPHAHGELPKFRTEAEFEWQVIQLFPYDPGFAVGAIHSWWYGYSADHNFLTDFGLPSTGTIENFTEQRVMRAVRTLRASNDFNIDEERIHAYGNSMGASGSVSLALRYPSVLSGVYASQPMMNYAASPTFIDDEFERIWGSTNVNLPIVNRGPYDDDIRFYGENGFQSVGVWDWMDHHQQLVERRGDDFAYLMISHGKSDNVIDWQTQGKPTIQALTSANAGFSAVANGAGHTWQGFDAVVSSMFGLRDDIPWTYPVDLSFPAIQNVSGSGDIVPGDNPSVIDSHNLDFEWATEHTPFDDAIVDLPDSYEITLRTTSGSSQTADITPHRTQQFSMDAGQSCSWTATDRNNSQLIGSGVVEADIDSLATVVGVPVVTGTGTRLAIDCAAVNPTVALLQGNWSTGCFLFAGEGNSQSSELTLSIQGISSVFEGRSYTDDNCTLYLRCLRTLVFPGETVTTSLGEAPFIDFFDGSSSRFSIFTISDDRLFFGDGISGASENRPTTLDQFFYYERL